VTTVIILAMVFVFVALRLWSVLGRRTGHEQPIAKPDLAPARSPAVTLVKPEAAALATDRPAAVPGATAGLRSITAADPRFDVAAFMEGARSAYRQILEAFWRADEPRLAELVDPEVAQAFGAAIAERREAGHVLDNRLVAIERAVISEASVEGRVARITVRFDADIAAVTRDGEGNVVAGSLTDAVETHDIWTFARNLRSDDPNWKLVETDEA
jgi:predicted lipid-binding transport protein (Tim44 family)